MSDLTSVNLKVFIVDTINEVFDTMLSMQVSVTDAGPRPGMEGSRIVGLVSLVGDVVGSVAVCVDTDFARIITAAMLGMDPNDLEEEEIHDVIGELSNMIGGDLKSKLCDSGFPCKLSIPSITSGSDFKIEPMEWLQHKCLAVKNGSHTAFVETFIKNGN